MSEPSGFELEEQSTPSPAQPAAGGAPPAPEEGAPSPVNEPVRAARRENRFVRLPLGMAVGFLLVGWICLGPAAWAYVLAGAATGAWGAWRRRSEVVLGSVAAVVGLATWFAVAGFVPGFGMGTSIIGCGIVGFLAGLDDRLRRS